MGWWRDLVNWRNAPVQGVSPSFSDDAAPWGVSPLNFTLELPPEMAMGGSLYDGPLEVPVGRRHAMSVPAVKRSRDLICGTLGSLPVRQINRKRVQVPSKLLEQPEIDVARSVTMTRTFEDMLFEGRAWWRVTAFGWDGYPEKIVRLDPRTVNVREEQRVYVSTDTGNSQGSAMEYVPDRELIRIDSPNDPLLVAAARAIRIALLLDQTASRYANEPFPLGYFSPEGEDDPGTTEEIEAVLDQWSADRKRRSWAYVGKSLKPNILQWNPEQLQLSAARDHAVLEISRHAGIDPEDLGVSTTSRTYANAEQRRLDLLDFTLAAYVSAFEDRLSMADVTPNGNRVRFQYTGFLRSDTLTRMQTYQLGREVGVYNDERIAELEDIPTAHVPKPPTPDVVPVVPAQKEEPEEVKNSLPFPVVNTGPFMGESLTFADEPALRMTFDAPAETIGFKADGVRRVVSGVTIPWGAVARSAGYRWRFMPNSLHWGSAASRVKLNKDHDRDQSFGKATVLDLNDVGLSAQFSIARGALGDSMLQLAEDGVYDGFSIEADFQSDGDGWEPDPQDPGVRNVHSATLRAVALTAMPAFDGARVAHVAAKREDTPMTAQAATEGTTPPAAPPPAAPAAVDLTKFTADLTESMTTAFKAAVESLPAPQGRPTIPAGRGVATVGREPLVYSMQGHGHSMIKDAWRARTEGDHEARERLTKFKMQLDRSQEAAAAFEAETSLGFAAANTTNAAAVIPPGYRPDLYVTQLLQGRPLWGSVSRGSLTDATPFTIPSYTSSSGMAANHVEGTNPTVGSLAIGTVTVTPGAVSGLFKITREIADSSNPAIDAIATQAMSEAYSQNTEAKLYAELNGANGQGGTITAGKVPSGAYVYTSASAAGTLGGEKLLATERQLLAEYPFHRFASPTAAHLSAEGTTAFATAVDTTGRHLLPSVGAQNAVGVGNAMQQGWYVDGLPNVPTWSMSGNAAGDADVLVFNRNDIWAWESPLLTFRFEERDGPANIDLALFGYVAVRLLRPAGLHAIRHTVTP